MNYNQKKEKIMFCRKCGKELFDEAVVCPNCGCTTNNYATYTQKKSGKFTAAKVFIIIGMVFQFFLIFPIIVGAIALSKIDKATRMEDLSTMSIFVLLFCNLIAGIIMLTITNEDLGRKENVLY